MGCLFQIFSFSCVYFAWCFLLFQVCTLNHIWCLVLDLCFLVVIYAYYFVLLICVLNCLYFNFFNLFNFTCIFLYVSNWFFYFNLFISMLDFVFLFFNFLIFQKGFHILSNVYIYVCLLYFYLMNIFRRNLNFFQEPNNAWISHMDDDLYMWSHFSAFYLQNNIVKISCKNLGPTLLK